MTCVTLHCYSIVPGFNCGQNLRPNSQSTGYLLCLMITLCKKQTVIVFTFIKNSKYAMWHIVLNF